MKLLIVFLFCSLNIFAQQDPVYMLPQLTSPYYNFASDFYAPPILLTAGYRNQSGSKLYASQSGYVSASYRGFRRGITTGLTYEYDNTFLHKNQIFGISESFYIFNKTRYSLRMGLRLNARHFQADGVAFSGLIYSQPYPEAGEFEKWTYRADVGLYFQREYLLCGLSSRNILGGFINQIRTDSSGYHFFHAYPVRTLYGFVSLNLLPYSNSQLRVNISATHMPAQTMRYFVLNANPPVSTLENTFIYKRNGDVPFSMQLHIDMHIKERFLVGLTAQGFHSSIRNTGIYIQFNNLQSEFGLPCKISLLAMAPKKDQGVTIETSLQIPVFSNNNEKQLPPQIPLSPDRL